MTSFASQLGQPISGAAVDAAFATKIDASGGDASATNATLGGSYLPRTLQSRIGDHPTVFDFVTSADSPSDYGPAINRCLTAGYPCEIIGILPVLTPIVCTLPGAILFGRDRATCGLAIPQSAAATMYAAGGLINASGLVLGPTIRDLNLSFAQPATGTAWVNYGAAITLHNTARARLRNLRITLGYDGIKVTGDTATGGSGGLVCENLETSCLGTNVALDGCYDSVRFVNPQIWPFGILTDGGVPLHPNYVNLDNQFMDNAIGYNIGRVDNLMVLNGLTIMVNALIMGAAADGSTFGTFSNHDFDTFGGASLGAALMTFENCTFTLGNTLGASLVANNGANITTLSNCTFLANSIPAGTSGHCVMQIGAGSRVAISGGTFQMAANTIGILADGAGTSLLISGTAIVLAAAGAYSSPIVLAQNGARLTFVGNDCTKMTTTGVVLVAIGTDVPGVAVGNSFGGTKLQLPSGYTQFQQGLNAGCTVVTV